MYNIHISVKITLGQLRNIVRGVLREAAGGRSTPAGKFVRNALSPEKADREQLRDLGTSDDVEGLAAHLVDPEVDPEDCWGPVPPVVGDPYVGQDPFVRDSSPLPSPRIYN